MNAITRRDRRTVISFADDPGTVLAAFSDAVVVVDSHMVVTSVNEAALNLVGASDPAELIGRLGTDWVHEPDRLDAGERLGAIVSGGGGQPASLRLVRKDGSLVWVEATGAMVPTDGPTRVALSFRNVDWRHAADLDAARVVHRSHTLVTAALLLQSPPPGGVGEALDAIVDGIGSAVGASVVTVHEVDPNESSMALRSRWLSPRRAHTAGSLPTRTVPLEQIPNWVNALNSPRASVELADDPTAAQAELLRLEPAIGEGISLALKPQGRLLGALTIGRFGPDRLSSDERDFLDRAAEIIGVALERRRSERDVVESEAMFRDLFENNSAVMYIVDPVSLRLVDANPAASRFYGYPRASMAGKDLHELTVHSRSELVELIQSVRSGGSTTIIDEQQQLSTGEIRTVEIHATPIRLGRRVLDLAIVQDVTEQRRALERLERLASTDDLTGALNRRRFLEAVAEEITRTERYGHDLSLLMLDLDHFKAINDRWGHLAGDSALVAFADVCHRHLRGSDRFARMGGEEFALLLPETDLVAARAIGERIRAATEQLEVGEADEQAPLTVSIGGAQWAEGWVPDTLFASADRALYRAKQQGRNRVES